ncbi:MAG: hypothetical protein JRN52_00160 [Nitrososphaerota archaeon]|nr:hypothetical protein [Nitrososphaerota archaeon]
MEEYDILRCIDRALDAFGSSVKNAIFWRMSTLHNSASSEVISDPAVFVGVVEEICNGSSFQVEASIIKEIRQVFDLPVEKTRSLATALNAAKQQLSGTVLVSPNAKFAQG